MPADGIAVSAALARSDCADQASGQQAEPATSEAMLVQLDGFEGPLDLLLDLARRQQVDLARISVLALVDQYVATIDRIGLAVTGLERAADWLVMAAWLTWLKSRLLLPKESKEALEAERAAGILVDRLAQMVRVRSLAAWLEARPQLGRDTYPRGAPEVVTRTLAAEVVELFEACLVGLRWRPPLRQTYVPRRPLLWGVADAIARLRGLIGAVPDGAELARFLPPHLFAMLALADDPITMPTPLPDRKDLPLQRRGAVAATLMGALELAREARIHLRQEDPFGPILIHPAPADDDSQTAPAQAA
jgi:segregation and condensation protein A